MALTYVDQATLVANVAWQRRVEAAAADVAQSQIMTLAETAPNEYRLKQLAVRTVTSNELTQAFCRLIAAGFAAGVSALATPAENTATDAQLKTQARAAFDALLSR